MDSLKQLFLLLSCFLILVFGSSPLVAAPDIKEYGALPSIQMMSISPSGKLIAFRKVADGKDVVLVVSLEKNTVVGGLDISTIKPRHMYFFDNTRLILVASEEKRLRGYKGLFHDISTAFLYDTESGELGQMLTPGDVIHKAQTGLGRISGVSGDGRYAFMPAFVGKDKYDNAPNLSLVRVDLESMRRPRVHEKGSRNTVDYFVDVDGNVLAEEIFDNRRNYHVIVAHNGNEETEIFRQDTEFMTMGVVGLTPDYKGLVILRTSELTGRTTYYTMSLADGTLSEPIFGREDADIESVLTDINRVVHGVIYSGLTPSYQFFDTELNDRMTKIKAVYPKHSVWLVDWSSDWQHLVVKIEGTASAGDFMLYSAGASPRLLTNARPTIRVEDINPVVEFNYTARDGLNIPTILTIPLDKFDTLENLPAVMLPHGGPEAHDWVGFDWLPQALASRGYLVIQPQFRGSSGFGEAHRRAGEGEWGRKMQDDLTDGLKLLAEQKVIDPKRVCIAGASYGGYAALAGGAFNSELYQCIVAINGVSDLGRMLKADKSKYGADHWVMAYLESIIALGDANKTTLNEISPANFAEDFKSPVLLVHGTKDKRVPYDQAKYMYKKLKRAKKPVTLVKLKNEDHHLSQPETRMEALEATIEFIDQHIGKRKI